MAKRLKSNRLSHLGYKPESFPTEKQKKSYADFEESKRKPPLRIYLWYWQNGGYNYVQARSRAEALKAAKQLGRSKPIPKEYGGGKTVGLKVDVKTLRVVTSKQLEQVARSYAYWD